MIWAEITRSTGLPSKTYSCIPSQCQLFGLETGLTTFLFLICNALISYSPSLLMIQLSGSEWADLFYKNNFLRSNCNGSNNMYPRPNFGNKLAPHTLQCNGHYSIYVKDTHKMLIVYGRNLEKDRRKTTCWYFILAGINDSIEAILKSQGFPNLDSETIKIPQIWRRSSIMVKCKPVRWSI